MTAAAVTGNTAHRKTGMVDLLSANVEALAREESGERYAICYYESRVRTGYSFIFCPECPKQKMDEKGKGTYTKCYY